MNIKYLSIGFAFVGAFLIKERIVKELYESGKLTDAKVKKLKSQINDLSDHGLNAYNKINDIESTIRDRYEQRYQQHQIEG